MINVRFWHLVDAAPLSNTFYLRNNLVHEMENILIAKMHEMEEYIHF